MSAPYNFALAFLRALLARPINIYLALRLRRSIRARNWAADIHIKNSQRRDRVRATSSCRANLFSAAFLYFANMLKKR